MVEHRKIAVEDEAKVVADYQANRLTIVAIGLRYGLSRLGIYKVLKRNGVDTKKRSAEVVECPVCKKMHPVRRSRGKEKPWNICCRNRDCINDYMINRVSQPIS
jgi:hypothetical protein